MRNEHRTRDQYYHYENGRLTVFGPYEHLDDYDYPNRVENYYRVAPIFDYDADTPAKLVVDGTLTLEGGLAGRVHVGGNGLIDQKEWLPPMISNMLQCPI